MPVLLPNHPTVLVRRSAFERAGLVRAEIDARFGLTDEEFHVEGELIVIGPLYGADAVGELTAFLEERELGYFDDFFDLSGNWPDWLRLYVRAERAGGSAGS